jgi:hypothetical protein
VEKNNIHEPMKKYIIIGAIEMETSVLIIESRNLEELELRKDIRIAEEEITKGKYLSNEEAKERLLT